MAFSPLLPRTCRVRVLATWVALCAGLAGPLSGQEIPKPDYITYMPGGLPLPGAEHLELDCGHVPQLERPRATHEAMLRFLGC